MQTIRQGLNVHTDNLSSLANKDIQVNSGVVQKYETSTGSVTIKQGVDVYVVTPTNNAVTVTIPSGLGINNYVRTVEIIIHNSSNTNSNTVTVNQTGYSIAYGYTSYTFVTNLVLNVSILGTLLIIRSSDDVVGRAVADSVGNPILTTYAKKTDVVNKSTQLTDIQDLNTIKTEGIYYQSLNANATAANHYPVTKAGSLVVLKNSASGPDGCTQLYYPYETQVQYQRKYLAASTSWTPWDTGVNSLMRNTAYKVGDIAYSPNLPSWAYLECITAGTTGDTEPDFSTVGGGNS